MTNKQTPLHRLTRLVKGQCPIYGVEMIQADADSSLSVKVFCCPLPDCAVMATRYEGGTFGLLPEFRHLLAKEW